MKIKLLIKQKILWFAVIIILAWIISSRYMQFVLVQGVSMEPTLHNLEIVILIKNIDEFQQGDLIAFRTKGERKTYIKRIIACEGDMVYIEDGDLFVNDCLLENNRINYKNIGHAGLLSKPILLEKGEYIVLGDNLSVSIDSRYKEIGIIRKGDIRGKIIKFFG